MAPSRTPDDERTHFQLPGSWSPDGQPLAFVERHPTTGRDIWLLPGGRRSDSRLATGVRRDEGSPRFSPDGRWLAYVSNESGPAHVYVRASNGSGASRRLSVSSGSEPVWRPDGSGVYFRSDGRLLIAPLAGGAPRVVYDGAAEPGTVRCRRLRRDGRRQSLLDAHERGGGRCAVGVAHHSQLDAGDYFFTVALPDPLPEMGCSASSTALIMSSIFARAGS